MRPRTAALAIAVVLLANLCLLADAPKDVFALSPADFAMLDAAKAPLEKGRIDDRLLAAAVFHETNRIRAEHKLRTLRYHDKLGEAAAIQSRDMAEHRYVEHENPHDEGMRWPMDRVRSTGYQPRSVSENVAQVFRHRYEPPKPYYKVEEAGRVVFSHDPDGRQPIPPHDYVSFARFLLDEWMGSPGHRANILREESEEFGAAVSFDWIDGDLDKAYATQIFARPAK